MMGVSDMVALESKGGEGSNEPRDMGRFSFPPSWSEH